jgi:hypothetical protein
VQSTKGESLPLPGRQPAAPLKSMQRKLTRRTTGMRAQVFGQFGALAGPRAVNLKSQKDKPSFAFIDFAQASSASSAITTPVSIAQLHCRVSVHSRASNGTVCGADGCGRVEVWLSSAPAPLTCAKLMD